MIITGRAESSVISSSVKSLINELSYLNSNNKIDLRLGVRNSVGPYLYLKSSMLPDEVGHDVVNVLDEDIFEKIKSHLKFSVNKTLAPNLLCLGFTCHDYLAKLPEKYKDKLIDDSLAFIFTSEIHYLRTTYFTPKGRIKKNIAESNYLDKVMNNFCLADCVKKLYKVNHVTQKEFTQFILHITEQRDWKNMEKEKAVKRIIRKPVLKEYREEAFKLVFDGKYSFPVNRPDSGITYISDFITFFVIDTSKNLFYGYDFPDGVNILDIQEEVRTGYFYKSTIYDFYPSGFSSDFLDYSVERNEGKDFYISD